MNYGSVCSGVEAASLAWRHLGWTPAFFSEVEPFPAAVLMQRLGAMKPLRPLDPDAASDEKDRKQRLSWQKQIAGLPDGGTIPNLGDFTLIKKDDYDGQIDLLVGGTPCQDLSIAGKRLGFEGRRSVLALDFVRLCFELGVRWVVWENVPAAFPAAAARISDDLFPCSVDGMSRSLKADGENAGSSLRLREDSEWHGEYLTLNLPEWNNFRGQSRTAGSVSSLSDILVSGNIPPRYYLTVKCAEGILRRAARRGKTLPPVLKEALLRQTGGTVPRRRAH